MRLNRSEVAEAFDIDRGTVSAWERRGCPILQRGSRRCEAIFDLKAVLDWRIAYLDEQREHWESLEYFSERVVKFKAMVRDRVKTIRARQKKAGKRAG